MTVDTFKASVQYGDLKGTAAADRADQKGADDWLEKKGLKQADEFLLGIELWVGENHGTHKDPVSVHFLLVTSGGHGNVKSMLEATRGPVDVRRVSQEMPISEFFSLFKRFSVCISPFELLTGREFKYVE
jgi:hypothetical protein